MRRHLKASCLVLFLGTLLFGVVYPLFVYLIAHLFFPWQAEGSPLMNEERVVGLYSIGQPFADPAYFWPRPSDTSLKPFNTFDSGGSNLSWTSSHLRKEVLRREAFYARAVPEGTPIPEDLLMASASGLDPEISLKAALIQVPRIASARKIDEEALRSLVMGMKESGGGVLFPKRVNVLKINLKLDHRFPRKEEAH
jgi:potassium-transporting ATPase KdpC subunit